MTARARAGEWGKRARCGGRARWGRGGAASYVRRFKVTLQRISLLSHLKLVLPRFSCVCSSEQLPITLPIVNSELLIARCRGGAACSTDGVKYLRAQPLPHDEKRTWRCAQSARAWL